MSFELKDRIHSGSFGSVITNVFISDFWKMKTKMKIWKWKKMKIFEKNEKLVFSKKSEKKHCLGQSRSYRRGRVSRPKRSFWFWTRRRSAQVGEGMSKTLKSTPDLLGGHCTTAPGDPHTRLPALYVATFFLMVPNPRKSFRFFCPDQNALTFLFFNIF